MPYQLVINSPSFKKVIQLQNSCYTIGRHPNNTIVIPSPQVSRHHATLIKKINPNLETAFYIVDGDLNGHRSRNGVCINGEPRLEYELSHGDVIILAADIKLLYQVIPSEEGEEEEFTLGDRNRVTLGLTHYPPQEQWNLTLIPQEQALTSLDVDQLTRLAACIEYSPYPMLEVDYAGNLTYTNMAARKKFPTLNQDGTDHPLLQNIIPDPKSSSSYPLLTREVIIGDKCYEQHIHYPTANQFIRTYIFDITERKIIEQSLNYQAFYDPLTDLPNRFLFKQELNKAISLASHQTSTLGLVLLGFRELQSLNDVLGHSVADDVLKAITERLTAQIRVEDLLCRWRGDSFIVLIRSCRSVHEIEIFVQRLLLALKRPHFIVNHPIYLQGYAGIALYPDDAENAEELINRVGIALNQVKDMGNRQYCFFEQTMNSGQLERIHLEHALHQAIDREEFELYYQPLINVQKGQLCGVEALLRWHHPNKGLVAPGEFIHILEATGLIIPVGEWVMRKAFTDFKDWESIVSDDFRIAINLSPQQFQDPNLLLTIVQILKEHQISPERLEVEITENLVMHNVLGTQNLLNALQSKGIRLSMDDFGTGYSSLSYLKSFPFNTLKIDRTFTKDILEKPEESAIIQSILLLGQGFKLNIVAEGIETEAQAFRLVELGCHEMQGYWFSRPLSHAQITEFLQENMSQQFKSLTSSPPTWP